MFRSFPRDSRMFDTITSAMTNKNLSVARSETKADLDYPPDFGYRSRSWHIDGGLMPSCPERGFQFHGGGTIFLRGSAGAGAGIQFNVQKEMAPNVDITEGWSTEIRGAWNVYGATIDFGGGGFGTWTYVE